MLSGLMCLAACAETHSGDGTSDASDASQPTAESDQTGSTLGVIDPATLATIPSRIVPANATLRVAVNTPVGELQVFDDPASGQTCQYLRTAESSSGGCVDQATIADGLAYSLIGGEHESQSVAYGIFPVGSQFSVTVGTRTVSPDDNGIWYAAIPADVAQFTLNAPDGSTTIDIPG